MKKPALIFSSVILLMSAASSVAAASVSLFDVPIVGANRQQLHAKIVSKLRPVIAENKDGIVLERGKEDLWVDRYKSDTLLQYSSNLYVGYTRQDDLFAFAEYVFSGNRLDYLKEKLGFKYGAPKAIDGKFLTDTRYEWIIDGARISLRFDWPAATRVLYEDIGNMENLKNERKRHNGDAF